ncbi:hypothetical protein ACIBHX_08490 [Nonomuraea sp. NPDC050536]|uniref:hypothetical protein n=1 Tax=Nonomuraea sp. NPDC050536 TaxID=3364366 RepID=UPI0037C94B89
MSFLAAAATTALNATGSMGFRTAVVVPGCDDGVDPIDVSERAVVVDPEVSEQLAIKRATQGASPVMARALRERRPAWRVLGPFFAWETLIVTPIPASSKPRRSSSSGWPDRGRT